MREGARVRPFWATLSSLMTVLGQMSPRIRGPLPGERSRAYVETLARTECPAFTTRRARRAERAGAPHDPIVWAEATGCNVVDADGNVFVDLTSGFGVAAIGHRHPRVVAAIEAQSRRLLHALGDVHPSDVKVDLLDALCERAPWNSARAVLSLNGADAVETALKTAVMATGRPGVLAFEGGYHGLSLGPLSACGYSKGFRAPFEAQLNPHVAFAPWPEPDADPGPALSALSKSWSNDIGAVLVEPIQGRGGVRPPPPGFLEGLGKLARRHGTLVIADEIMTGLGRCGTRWRSVDAGLVPDLICTGKALGGGLPVSACLGRTDVMGAWGTPDGEALHTGTFFGHPLGCASALATLEVLEGEDLAGRARELGDRWMRDLSARDLPRVRSIRGEGLMVGLELDSGMRCLALLRELLESGYLALPAGADARVLQLLPPLTIDYARLAEFTDVLEAHLRGVS